MIYFTFSLSLQGIYNAVYILHLLHIKLQILNFWKQILVYLDIIKFIIETINSYKQVDPKIKNYKN